MKIDKSNVIEVINELVNHFDFDRVLQIQQSLITSEYTDEIYSKDEFIWAANSVLLAVGGSINKSEDYRYAQLFGIRAEYKNSKLSLMYVPYSVE